MSWLSALIACGAGFTACPVYAVLRFLGRKSGFAAVAVLLDVVCGALAAAAVAAVGFFFNDGIVKLYMVLAAVCGFTLARLVGVLSVDFLRRKR